MQNIETRSASKSLLAFCEGVLSRHQANWPPSEDLLAKEFVREFSPRTLLGSEQIVQLSRSLGIGTTLTNLPDGIHGFNCSTEVETIILLREKEGFPGSREHTFFHELREILEYNFSDLGSPTMDASNLEQHAEQFAVCVRMAQFFEVMKFFVESMKDVEANWKRWLACAGIFIFSFAWCLSCALLPHFEDKLSSPQ